MAAARRTCARLEQVEEGAKMETILIPLDGSDFGEHALPLALSIARRGRLRLGLTHVHHLVIPPATPDGGMFFAPEVDKLVREQEAAYLEAVSDRIAAVWDGPVTRALLEAPVADALCQHAHTIGAALVVLCTHGRGGVARAWLGSVADRVLRQSTVPTLVVHPTAGPTDLRSEPPLEHILIPLDGSPLAEQAIDHALWLGRLTGARYTLLRVVEPIMHGFYVDDTEPAVNVAAQEAAWREATSYLEAVAERLRSQDLTVSIDTRIGKPEAEIREFAAAYGAHLIAMATHGRGGVRRLLVGSVADKILRGATVPLLITRPVEAPAADNG
jgi:nucleotide-binding universal stress UspA family protein